MVGLLINTVPVRAKCTPATTTAGLLDQLHRTNNDTLEHQHLALSEIHHVTGHEQLFDTLFVFENYPVDTANLVGVDGLAITGMTAREFNHYPLTLQAMPGTELGLRVEYNADVLTADGIQTPCSSCTTCLRPWSPTPPAGCRRFSCWTPTSRP